MHKFWFLNRKQQQCLTFQLNSVQFPKKVLDDRSEELIHKANAGEIAVSPVEITAGVRFHTEKY